MKILLDIYLEQGYITQKQKTTIEKIKKATTKDIEEILLELRFRTAPPQLKC